MNHSNAGVILPERKSQSNDITDFTVAGIEPDKVYTDVDLEEKGLNKRTTFKQWRSQGKGPPYIKAGSRVIYAGHDLIDYYKQNRVNPGT